MAAGAALPGVLFCLAATVLLVFASISSPTWNTISFLNASQGGQTVHFGVFGNSLTSGTHIGYNFPSALGIHNSANMHRLTQTLILVPIAAGIAGLATIFGLIGAAYHRVGTVLMTLLAALGSLVALVAWVLAMVLFGAYAKTDLKRNGWSANYHNAMWFVLAAWLSLAIGFCVSALGSFGRYRRNRNAAPATYPAY